MSAEEAFVLAADLTGMADRAGPELARQIRLWGFIGRGQVVQRAHGRPGPRRVTGDYTRSWNVEFVSIPGGQAAIIGTAAVQGRRLEHGFHGTDALGRNYNQPPYPHVGPAADWLELRIEQDSPNTLARIAGASL